MRTGNSTQFHILAIAMLLVLMVMDMAHAHVSLAEPSAAPGTRYVGQFRIGHGCSGAPTTAISIAIPASLTAVEPQARPGWMLTVTRQAGRVTGARWEGGSIASDKPESFALAMTLPAQEGVLAFPVTQSCAAVEQKWDEVPAAGEKAKRPAPLLTIAATRKDAALQVRDGWFRALPPSVPSGGYFTLRNESTQTVTLADVESPACGMLMMHKTSSSGMEHVMALDVPAGGQIAFSPGGYHLMCMDSRPMLKPGATVPVTLRFQNGQKLTADFQVRTATGK